MLPSPWVGVVLAFAAYRLLRLAGWDDWPPILRVRRWVIGEHWVPGDPEAVELPGKTPSSEAAEVRPAYRRPTLAHMIHCPFCMGFWVSVGVLVAWWVFPTEALYGLAPFALSGAIGLMAKNWDP